MQAQSLILLVLFGGLLFLMFNRTRRQQREAQELQAKLTVGARVMTTAGLYATVVDLDSAVVTLETAPGQQSRWDRRAVARIVTDDGTTGEVNAEETHGAADGEPHPAAGERSARENTIPDDAAGPSAPSPDTAPPDRA
ncbi:MAG TPA: preprotein translocase subunit YajC [Kineosporiaceae bacterium]